MIMDITWPSSARSYHSVLNTNRTLSFCCAGSYHSVFNMYMCCAGSYHSVFNMYMCCAGSHHSVFNMYMCCAGSYHFMFNMYLCCAGSYHSVFNMYMCCAGSYHSVLGLSILWAFVLSLAPVLFYLVVCLSQKNDVQIKVGAVLTALYTVVMMIATVGTLVSIATESFNSPNVVFLSGLFVIFFVASLLHPQEFFCLVYGGLYFLVVPSTFILLTVYYLCNLNNVSWGTREMPRKLTAQEEAAERQAEAERAKRRKRNVFSLYGAVSLVQELRDAVRGLWGLRAELQQQGNVTLQPAASDVEKGATSSLQPPVVVRFLTRPVLIACK